MDKVDLTTKDGCFGRWLQEWGFFYGIVRRREGRRGNAFVQ